MERREDETERPVTEERPLLNDPLHPRVVEDGEPPPPLPLRVVEDGEPAPPLPPRMIEDVGSTSTVLPRLETAITLSRSHAAERSSHDSPGDFIDQESNSIDPLYSQPVLLKTLNMVPPPAVTEKLIYDDIQGFQNQKVMWPTQCFWAPCD